MAAHRIRIIFIAFVFIVVYSESVEGNKIIQRNPEPIDGGAGKFKLGWEVNFETEIITFNIEVETKGFVGFGLSNTGGMTGADIIIGGVFDNGIRYFSDRHGVGNSVPIMDEQQDWVLNSASETGTHTFLNVSRPLQTCDEDGDIAITRDTIKLIWSYGATDVIEYHLANRGSYSVNLLDPPMPPFDESSVDKWLIIANATMPKKDTTYWCSIHKTPETYNSKRHVVGFNTKLDTAVDLMHTHHFIVYKCEPEPGSNQTAEETFEEYVGLEGGDCFVDKPAVPTNLCISFVYIWAIGGRMMTFPEDLGYPITEDGPEYYMVEMHYDNPELLEGVRVVSTLEVYNTLKHRPIEAGLGFVMQEMTYSHIVPPKADSYVTTGHCSSECTSESVPSTGANVFNVMLHSHKAGRKLKLRHFRGTEELPWISSDENYDFDFQQNRPLNEFVRILPGDHLTLECVQSTIDRKNVTISGHGTMNEMCQAIFWYYPLGSFSGCTSAYNETKMLQRFGIEEITPWHKYMTSPPNITAPVSMAGKPLPEVLSEIMADWNVEDIAALQEETRYHNNYQPFCGIPGRQPEVGYPEIDKPYVPRNPCFK